MKPSNCEWSPSNGVPAFDDDPHVAEARWSVGTDGCTDGNLHLCDDCAALPRFAKRKKVPLRRSK